MVDGAREIRIAGQTIPVQAKTHVLGGLSGHAGQAYLLNWLASLAATRPRVILTHGEDGPRAALRERIRDRFGLDAELPAYRETIEL